jgi:hypothetical protein
MADNNDEVKQTVELLEPVKDEKPLINKFDDFKQLVLYILILW